MASTALRGALNAQLNLEFYSSNLYLQMSAWTLQGGLTGCSAFLRKQAAEELEHMGRLFDYINEMGALAVVGAIASPPDTFQSVEQLFTQAYAHEQRVTASIHGLVEASMKEHDHATFNFLQWYVAEQREEENLFRMILGKLEMVGSDKRGLFFFDRELGALTAK